MEHKILSAELFKEDELLDIIRTHEKDAWEVAALGKIAGRDTLVLVKAGKFFDHQILETDNHSAAEINALIAEKIAEGCKICAVGEFYGKNLVVVKKLKTDSDPNAKPPVDKSKKS